MSAAFALNPRLAAGAFDLGALPLCRVLLKADARWPWLILAPQRADLEELHDLGAEDLGLLAQEIAAASRAMAAMAGVEKVNVAALGNSVRQLHIHVVGRRAGDPGWPGPIWGLEGKTAYAPGAGEALAADLWARLSGGS